MFAVNIKEYSLSNMLLNTYNLKYRNRTIRNHNQVYSIQYHRVYNNNIHLLEDVFFIL